MSKLEELVESLINSKENYEKYENECLNFMKELIQGFEEYLGAPEKIIKYYQIDDSNQIQYRNYISKIKIEDDGFWHAHIDIMLPSTLNNLKKIEGGVRTKVLVKKEDDYSIVKLINDTKEFKIKDGDFLEFYDYLFKEIKNLFDNSLENIKKGKADLKEDSLVYIQ